MAFSYYGNFGGPGWTNGSFAPPDAPGTWGKPKDDLDQLFKDHDTRYWDAEQALDRNGDAAKYREAIIKADNEFIRDVANIPRGPDWNPNDPRTWSPMDAAADSARDAFIAKQPYNYIDFARQSRVNIDKAITDKVRDLFNRGLNWRFPSDPLALDLDGDGVELTSASNTVLFDHNKDNIRTGTQWVRPDDGILVRDLNGNGVIDSGRELFGDQTALPPGFGSTLSSGGTGSGQGTLGTGLGGPQLATNGWQALSALDSNRDGIINASDAAFAELKVWRDLNQDGISQANELQTLNQAGVSSINLTPNAASNTLSQTASTYTTTAGTTRVAQNIDFTTNNFYSEFTDNPTLTATAAGLPQLQGAGFVRDMRETMESSPTQVPERFSVMV